MRSRPAQSTLFPYTTLFRSFFAPPAGGCFFASFGRSGTTSAEICALRRSAALSVTGRSRSEEHTSELQSQSNLVCRLLLEKKKDASTGVHPSDPTRTHGRRH